MKFFLSIKFIILTNCNVFVFILNCFFLGFLIYDMGVGQSVNCTGQTLTELTKDDSLLLSTLSDPNVKLDGKGQNTYQFANFTSHKEFLEYHKNNNYCVPRTDDFASCTEILVFTTFVVAYLLMNAYFT